MLSAYNWHLLILIVNTIQNKTKDFFKKYLRQMTTAVFGTAAYYLSEMTLCLKTKAAATTNAD